MLYRAGAYWKRIPGFEMYEVSNDGRVASYHRPMNGPWFAHSRPLKPSIDNSGYCLVTLTDEHGNKRAYGVHRLVAWAFIGPQDDGVTVNHKNGIKDDNRVENLEYLSAVDNIKHGHYVLQVGACIGEDKARAVCELLMNPKISFNAIGRRVGVSSGAVSSIYRRVTWLHISNQYTFPKDRVGHRGSRLTDDEVHSIKRLLQTPKLKQRTIAECFGVHESEISKIKHGIRYATID